MMDILNIGLMIGYGIVIVSNVAILGYVVGSTIKDFIQARRVSK